MTLTYLKDLIIHISQTIILMTLSGFLFKKILPRFSHGYYITLGFIIFFWIQYLCDKWGGFQYNSVYIVVSFLLTLVTFFLSLFFLCMIPSSIKYSALNITRDHLAWIINSTPCAIISLNLEGKIMSWNRGAEEIFGYRAEEVVGKDASCVLLPEDDPDTTKMILLKACQGGNITQVYDAKRRHKSGKPIDLLVTVSKLCNEKGDVIGACGIAADLTKVKTLESQLKETIKELESKNNALDSFSHIVAHDLKAPLRTIYGLSHWSFEELKKHPDKFEAQKYLQIIMSRVSSMEDLINDLLIYFRSRVERNILETVNTYEMAKKIVQMHLPCQSCVVHIDDNLPTFATYKIPFQQVLSNLISNAFKHHHDIDHSVIRISCKEDEKFYEFRVEDNGPGIIQKNYEKIFELFGGAELNEQVTIKGVGLATIKEIVESMGGNISVQSSPGKGTVFTFTWSKYGIDRLSKMAS